MQIKISKLREAMKLLEPVIPSKTTLPILHNVLLRDGKAIATDMETFVLIDLPEADIECLIPHKTVMQLLNYVPGNETLSVEVNKEVKFTWDSGKSSYPLTKVKDYPLLREITSKVQGTMDGNVLMTALITAVGYCAADETRPVLNCVAILPGEQLDIAAGDGFRMAYQTIPVSFPIDKPLLIPSGAVSNLRDLWRHTRPDVTPGDSLVGLITQKRQVEVTFAEGESGAPDKLRLCFSGVMVQIALTQGTPPNFKQLIPKEIPTKVQFFPEDLERAVKRLSAIAKDAKGKGMVKLSWTSDTMTVSAKSEEVGKVEGTLPVQADNPGKLGIDISYLLEYLKGREGFVTMGVSGEKAPILFRHRTSPLVLIMPMHLS